MCWKGFVAIRMVEENPRMVEETGLMANIPASCLACTMTVFPCLPPVRCIKQISFFSPTIVSRSGGMGHKANAYKYALTLVDVASRYKAAEPLTTKDSKEVASASERIYKCGPLALPKLLQVDWSREFMGEVPRLMVKHKTV